MTENEFIAREQAKLDLRLLTQLMQIKVMGKASRKTTELLWINGLIQGSPPVAFDNSAGKANCYNHDRLTQKGIETLERLSAEEDERRYQARAKVEAEKMNRQDNSR